MKGKSKKELAAMAKDLGEYKFESPEAEAFANEKIKEAEREYEECSVHFRWRKEQLDLVKEAAAKIGVPYQTYMKLCVFRQAQLDLGRQSSSEFEDLKEKVLLLQARLEKDPPSERRKKNS